MHAATAAKLGTTASHALLAAVADTPTPQRTNASDPGGEMQAASHNKVALLASRSLHWICPVRLLAAQWEMRPAKVTLRPLQCLGCVLGIAAPLTVPHYVLLVQKATAAQFGSRS